MNTEGKIDLSPSDFDRMEAELPVPVWPGPVQVFRYDFSSDEDYQVALKAAKDQRSEDYKEAQRVAGENVQRQIGIRKDFFEWAFICLGVDNLPENTLRALRTLALDEAWDDGYEDMFRFLEILVDVVKAAVDVVKAAYEAGKKAKD